MLLAKTLAVVGGVLTLMSTLAFLAEARIGAWEPKAAFCLHTFGLVVLGASAVLPLLHRIRALESKVEQAENRRG